MADSMTGYGREISEQEGTRVVVEVRSVNHRFLDVHTHLPSSLLFMEDSIRKRVKEAVQRGRVDVYITMDSGGFHTNVEVDWSAAEQYIQAMEGLKSRFHLTGDITIDMVSKLENVFVTKETEDVPCSFPGRASGVGETGPEPADGYEETRRKAVDEGSSFPNNGRWTLAEDDGSAPPGCHKRIQSENTRPY